MKLRKLLVLIIKIAVAVLVLSWMTYTGKLNFTQIGAAFRQWPQMIAIVVIVYLQIALMTWRWNILTNALGFGLNYRKAFSLSLIGLLFTVVLPGSVSGDLIKTYYLGKHAEGRRSQAFTTVLIDRYLGLLSLLAIGCVGVAFNWKFMAQTPILSTLATSVIVAFTAGTTALLVAVILSNRVTAWMRRLERIPMSGIVIRCLDALGSYRNRPGALLAGLCISLPAHLLACVGVYIAMSTVHAPIVSLESFLLAVPLGLITTTIPISPAGVGISQAAFYTLFTAIAPGSGTSASNAFTVYQTMQILVYLTGFVSYFAAGAKVRTEAAEAA